MSEFTRILNAINEMPRYGQHMKHQDGGIYIFEGMSQSTVDQSLWYLYRHVWPFERSTVPWARPIEEWASRFTPLTIEEMKAFIGSRTREQGQADVTAAKAARRAKEAQSAERQPKYVAEVESKLDMKKLAELLPNDLYQQVSNALYNLWMQHEMLAVSQKKN